MKVTAQAEKEQQVEEGTEYWKSVHRIDHFRLSVLKKSLRGLLMGTWKIKIVWEAVYSLALCKLVDT